jgi:predicted nucleic acid-binding protein
MSYYIDSCIFIGAFYKRDQHHKEAKDLLEKAVASGEKCYTSVYVLDEFVSHLTGKARDADRKVQRNDYECIKAGENAIQDSEVILLQVDEETIAQAKILYDRYWEHGMDLTDWTTAVLMKKNGISRVLTFDKGFDRLVVVSDYKGIERIK